MEILLMIIVGIIGFALDGATERKNYRLPNWNSYVRTCLNIASKTPGPWSKSWMCYEIA